MTGKSLRNSRLTKENTLQTISINELDKIEQSIATQRNRQSLRLLDRISPQEKIVFCVYSSTKTGLFSNQPDIVFAILTNFRMIYANHSAAPANTSEIMLDKLVRAEVCGNGILIYHDPQNPSHCYPLVAGQMKDKKMTEYLVMELNKAISQSKIQVRSATININDKSNAPQNDSVADQIKKLSELHQAGILTDEEFMRAKQRAIG